METTKTMRVTASREVAWAENGEPIEVEMILAEEMGGMPAMENNRVRVAIADQRVIGTKYSVVTTYTEITE